MLSIGECDDFFESSMGWGNRVTRCPELSRLALKAGILIQSPDITILMQNFFT